LFTFLAILISAYQQFYLYSTIIFLKHDFSPYFTNPIASLYDSEMETYPIAHQ